MMMNKRGAVGLKTIMLILVVFFGIIAFSNIFVSELATEYGNSNITDEYALNPLGADNLTGYQGSMEDLAEGLNKGDGILSLLGDVLTGLGDIFKEVLKAPITFGSLISSILGTIGVSKAISSVVGLFIMGALYTVIIFTIAKAVLKGGDL